MDSNYYCLRQSTITSMENTNNMLSSKNVHGLIQPPSTPPIFLFLHGTYHALCEPMDYVIALW